uniref:Uncharacterized protein n=1 Tax=Romanomermis culicivorax TaxID=13658 RepID=A0A915IMI4_ROMCU
MKFRVTFKTVNLSEFILGMNEKRLLSSPHDSPMLLPETVRLKFSAFSSFCFVGDDDDLNLLDFRVIAASSKSI